jgi:hypothetical protein
MADQNFDQEVRTNDNPDENPTNMGRVIGVGLLAVAAVLLFFWLLSGLFGGDETPIQQTPIEQTQPVQSAPTAPVVVDSDGDLIPDNIDQEPNNPCVPHVSAGPCDQDGDLLSNDDEKLLGTDPLKRDTDGDNLADNVDSAPNDECIPVVSEKCRQSIACTTCGTAEQPSTPAKVAKRHQSGCTCVMCCVTCNTVSNNGETDCDRKIAAGTHVPNPKVPMKGGHHQSCIHKTSGQVDFDAGNATGTQVRTIGSKRRQ